MVVVRVEVIGILHSSIAAGSLVVVVVVLAVCFLLVRHRGLCLSAQIGHHTLIVPVHGGFGVFLVARGGLERRRPPSLRVHAVVAGLAVTVRR